MVFKRRTFCFYLINIAVICIRLQIANSAKLSSKRYPSVDFFEYEFPGIGAEEYDPFGPNVDEADLSDDNDDPETKPKLFQGDIAIDPFTYITLRLGVNPMKHPKRLWPNATIPFEISYLFEARERRTIERVLKTFNALTCIQFVPYNGEDEDYVLIAPPEEGPLGCWSYVGRKGGEQIVSLQRPDEKSSHCFSSEGRIMHELMHAIGIYHEQSRADRDKYIKVNWENIIPKYRRNFKLISKKRGKYTYEYDYNSVMHYGEYYFSKSKGKKPSITPLQSGVKIGQRRTLSKMDCLKINDLYGCLKGRRAKMYRSFCHLLAL